MSRKGSVDIKACLNIKRKLNLILYKGIVKRIVYRMSVDKYSFNGYAYTEIKHFKKDESVTFMSGCNSEIYTLQIRDQVTPSNQDIYMLIKFPSETDEISDTTSSMVHHVIEHEAHFYAMVAYSLVNFVHDMTNYDKKHILVPKYYFDSERRECTSLGWIAIQNLEPYGFHAFNSRMDLTHDHVKLIFDRYGYFNAYSYLLKMKDFQKFSQLFSPLKKNLLKVVIESDRFSQNFQTVCSAINKFLKPEEDLTLINRFEKFIANGKEILVEYAEKTGKYDTVIHGNLSSNHLMFRKKIGYEKLVDLRFIDWKYAKMGSPVCDLSLCLYSGARKEVLNNLNEYLEIYRNSIISTLREFGCWNPEGIFTYEQLLEEWKTYSKFGFLMATQVIFMKCSIVDNLSDDQFPSSKMKLFKTLKYDEKKFETMMRDLLNHMVKNGCFYADSDLEKFDVI